MNSYITDAIKSIQNTLSREELQTLLTDAAAWKKLVAEAHLSREETDSLYEGLSNLRADTEDMGHRKNMQDSELIEDKENNKHKENLDDMEYENLLQKEQEYREMFLKEFPPLKVKLEELIAQFRALADKADKVHRDCTITNVVASSTGIVSGILTIVGIALAPVTVGTSLALTATGLGLGAASTVTRVSTSIVKYITKSSVETKGKCLQSDGINSVEMVMEVICDSASKSLSLRDNIIKSVASNNKKAKARELAQIHSKLAARATNLIATGTNVSIQSNRVIKGAIEGTTLALSKGVRVLGMGAAAAFILLDVVNLVQESIDLHVKTKTPSAKNLRQQAQELEKMLEELKEFNSSLQKMQETGACAEERS
ncbi:apolipoprotein L3-like isoform X2 [Erinaceus europaeus]|nr:apolipoprotein L3-like isoform X2 [Erinaceus europaeus]